MTLCNSDCKWRQRLVLRIQVVTCTKLPRAGCKTPGTGLVGGRCRGEGQIWQETLASNAKRGCQVGPALAGLRADLDLVLLTRVPYPPPGFGPPPGFEWCEKVSQTLSSCLWAEADAGSKNWHQKGSNSWGHWPCYMGSAWLLVAKFRGWSFDNAMHCLH